MLTFDNKAFRRVASFAPYDVVEIVVNGRTYGGGGIYNLYSTVAADNAFAPYVFVHEFGHHFAALADEYYTSPVAYLPASDARGAVGAERHGAARSDRRSKWKDLVTPGTPLPTPWEKDAYEKRLARDQARRAELREDRPARGRDGGAVARKRRTRRARCSPRSPRTRSARSRAPTTKRAGYYRPEVNCIMFTRTDAFCAVCRRALERVIDTYSRN